MRLLHYREAFSPSVMLFPLAESRHTQPVLEEEGVVPTPRG